MNRSTPSTEAAPVTAPEAIEVTLENGAPQVASGHLDTIERPLNGHQTPPPHHRAPRQSKALWASLLGAGAVGAVALAAWTQQKPVPDTPSSTPKASPSPASGPASSVFGLSQSAPTPAAPAPLFPGLGQLGGAKGGAKSTAKSPFPGAPASAGGAGKLGGAVGAAKVPPPVQAAFAAAVAAQKAGRIEAAVQSYREVLRLKPDAVEAMGNLATLFQSQKQPERAITQLEAARKLVPREPTILFQLAQAQLQAKQPAKAIEPLQGVIKIAPKNPTAQLLLAQVLSELKRTGPALAAWERLCELAPKDSAAALAAGAMALEGARQPERAARWLRRAVALRPSDPREPLLLGRALMAARKPKEAAVALRDGWKEFPEVVELGTALSDARLASGDIGGAAGALREVIKRVPESRDKGVPAGQLRIALARMLATQKQFEPAQQELREAARLLPRDADVLGLSVDMALRSGNWARAASSLDAMISIDPKRFPARVLVAREAARRKQLSIADAQYAKYLTAQGQNTEIIAERAVVLGQMGRTDEADALWKRAVVLLPDSPLPALGRARALLEAGRERPALEAFRFVLQNWPGDPVALHAAAQLEMKLGEPARAVARWRALINARPAFEPAYASLLEAARRVDQMPSALGFLKQQAARNPERPALYEAVLNVHARLGLAREGRAWVSNMSRLYPSARAPRRALLDFARHFPSLAGDDSTPTKPTPRATAMARPTPTAAPTQAPDAQPTAQGTGASPDSGVANGVRGEAAGR